MNWLALDVGGANLKVADGMGYSQSYPFPLWREFARLAQQIRTALSESPPCDHVAVTMTGELCDCFESKAAGVRYILEAVKNGADNRHSRVYLTDGRMVTPHVALTMPQLAAASNWHALARFAGRFVPQGAAILLDIGSTTCDVIPLREGQPVASGRTDTERLLAGELVYTGIERSPVCAVAHEVIYRGRKCPLAQELFATMQDAYVLLDRMPENLTTTSTADGRPQTKANARLRLARAIAADGEEFHHRDAIAAAQYLAEAQQNQLAAGIEKVRSRLLEELSAGEVTTILLSGHGEFLARGALEALAIKVPLVSLAKQIGQGPSRTAPAHALAVLAREATGK
jgi:probable H4MPT-linked C1 transfer pathway protein